MNKANLTTVVVLGISLAFPGPSVAAPKKHHPWLMVGKHTASSSSSPAVSGRGSIISAQKQKIDSPPVAARNDVKKGDTQGRRVVQQAMRYKGTRYKFGGTTKRGMDCSGLVARVWEDLKMKRVPRMSSALFHSGQPVKMGDLRPGDLVFFKNTYKHGISHVGVYTGNNKFVHAANRRLGVTIASLSDPYYQLHYAGARRLY
jgi:cell wall-associated NlpC family hydrolase